MKKETSLSRPHAGKLSLNKKTISNLTAAELSKYIGGSTGCYPHYPTGYTKKNTCPMHKTCVNC